jgi:hypothetical protein
MRAACLLLAIAAASPAAALTISSPAFPPAGAIPRRFACDGASVSPRLQFAGVPKGAKTLVLIVTDPDAPDPDDPNAPRAPFTHWVLYEVPAGTWGLSEAGDSQLPAGTRAGRNDFGKTGWGAPCPPAGVHHYVFRLHALDAPLGDLGEPSREALEKAMAGHVLATAELVGTYESTP